MEKGHILTIQNQAPNTWNSFKEYINSKFESFLSKENTEIDSYPFEFLVGVFHSYFLENGIELDLGNQTFEQIESEVVQAFLSLETVSKHYS